MLCAASAALPSVFPYLSHTSPCSSQEQKPQDPELQEVGVMLGRAEGCDNGNILMLIVQLGGLFVAQNHNAVWRYLELV